jgi:hypothetical protein
MKSRMQWTLSPECFSIEPNGKVRVDKNAIDSILSNSVQAHQDEANTSRLDSLRCWAI